MSNQDEIKPTEGHGALIARGLWAVGGPVVLLSTLMPIAKAWSVLWEIGYWITVTAMIAGRFWENQSGKGTTLYGDPMTTQNSRAYVVKLIVFCVTMYAVVKWLALRA